MNALLIEDHGPTADLLSLVLERDGLTVTSCVDAETAMTLLMGPEGPAAYPLLLVDIGLPGRDGIAFCEWLRARPGGSLPYVMMVTGRGRGEALTRALEAGANDYIEKPIEARHLSLRLAIAREHLEAHQESHRLRRQLDHEQGLVGALFETAGAFLVAFDGATRIRKINPACGHLAPEADLMGQTLHDTLFPSESHRDAIRAALGRTEQEASEFQLEAAHGERDSLRHVQWTFRRIGRHTADALWIASGADVTSHRREAERLAHVAEHDPLTQLYNRTHLEPALADLAEASRQGLSAAVLCVDLDHFKTVNDTAGHAAGDELLQLVARTLNATVRPSDTLIRTGGDEFVVLLPKASPIQAKEVAERIRAALAGLEFSRESRVFHITASIGVAMMEPDRAPREILELADAASYSSKTKGRNKVTTSPQDHFLMRPSHESAEDRAWYRRVVTVLDYQAFDLWLQPVMDLATNEPAFSEALLRLPNDKTWDTPARFIEHARRHHLMVDLDRAVIQAALDLLQSQPALTLSVNLSGLSVTDPRLPEFLRHAARRAGVPLSRMIFEITETDLIPDLELAQRILSDLCRDGCRFALDDFGEGYSAFACLRHLPLEMVKIDGAFSKHLSPGSPNHSFMKAIRELSRLLDIACVAEKVETEADLVAVRGLGVDYAQGFLLGHPEPVHPPLQLSERAPPGPGSPIVYEPLRVLSLSA